MRKRILFIVIATFLLVACNNDKNIKVEEHDHSSHEMGDRKLKSSAENPKILSGLIDSYLVLKNALVNDDNKKAASSAQIMLKAFTDFDMNQLSETQHKEYMEISENSQEQLEHIIKSPIDHQREHFEILSTDLSDLITLIGTDKHLYLDFCSMFNNGKGATWVSETSEISNPYYGSKMIDCGNVQKEFN